MRHRNRTPSRFAAWLAGLLLAGLANTAVAQQVDDAPAPRSYRTIDGKALNAYVFAAAGYGQHKRGAIVLLHPGGWEAGEASWVFDDARRFAALGLVAIAVDYRLSEGKVTPAEALDDSCAAFEWTRQQAKLLDIDPQRIAAYGVSAGGQLAAAVSTGLCKDKTHRPAAVILLSPVIDTATFPRFGQLLNGRASPRDYSPIAHVDHHIPPTLLIQGTLDNVAPLASARGYCEAMRNASDICELATYDGVGHLLTRNLKTQQSDFDLDPRAVADSERRQADFLRAHGFLPTPHSKKTP